MLFEGGGMMVGSGGSKIVGGRRDQCAVLLLMDLGDG